MHLDGIQTRYGQCLLLERNRASHDRTTVRNRYIPNALWPVSALWSGRGRVVTGCERAVGTNRTALHKISTIVAPPSSEQTVSVCCASGIRVRAPIHKIKKPLFYYLKRPVERYFIQNTHLALYPKYTLGARPAVVRHFRRGPHRARRAWKPTCSPRCSASIMPRLHSPQPSRKALLILAACSCAGTKHLDSADDRGHPAAYVPRMVIPPPQR